ncbi:MAG: hypothetical protein ACREXU_01075 [Gammaproteobacteria bacterium]
MEPPQLNWIARFIWGIADDVLRDLYVRGKYRDLLDLRARASQQRPTSSVHGLHK